MFKRVSLVWKQSGLSRGEFAALWLGEHAEQARRLPGLLEYVVDVVEDSADGMPDGIATLRFDSRHACEAAFATPGLAEELARTRQQFARDVRVFSVEEHLVHRNGAAS